MDARTSVFTISRTCHDSEFVVTIVDTLIAAHQTEDPSVDAENTFREMLSVHEEVAKGMREDLHTAHSIFKEMLRNEARGKPH